LSEFCGLSGLKQAARGSQGNQRSPIIGRDGANHLKLLEVVNLDAGKTNWPLAAISQQLLCLGVA
jgi:hypothetical protein